MTEHTKVHRFAPSVGVLEYRLLELNRSIASGKDVQATIDSMYAEDVLPLGNCFPTLDEHRWAIALSLLKDLIAAGASLFSRDCCLYVAWPDWKTPESRARLRLALQRLREEPGRAAAYLPRPSVVQSLPSSLSASRVLQLLREGNIRMRAAEESLTGDITYRDVFRSAVRSWSMPHRDREGRRAQFVVVVEHSSLATPLPIGILEAGDGPPYMTRRDERFGLTSRSFDTWISDHKDRPGVLQKLEYRINLLLDALIFSKGHRRGDHDRTLRNLKGLQVKAAGRSTSVTDLSIAKRAVYLERLSKALRGVRALAAGSTPEASDLYALVRAVRDVSLPSLNVELSICGALPPFSSALVGKLVAAFAADPRVTRICQRPLGGILEQAFDLDKLAKALPRHGALLVTTQGLYADHSAQYNGVLVPALNPSGSVRLEKIGTTDGATTSLISRRTDRLSSALAEALDAGANVSNAYGSGGSKRQRRLENAIELIGLNSSIMHPGIRRPVYGLELVSNLRDVVLLCDQPVWCVKSNLSIDEYAEQVVSIWRQRWLPTAERRLLGVERAGGNDLHPGVQLQLAG